MFGLLFYQFGTYNEHVGDFLSALGAKVCKEMQELTISNLRNGKWNTMAVHSKEQRLLNVKLINVISRFRNLNKLHLLVPDLISTNLDYLFECCTKLTDLAVCTKGIQFRNEVLNIKRNCPFIRNITLLIERNKSPMNEYLLQNIFKLIPDATIQVIYDNGKYSFTAKPTKFEFLRS